MYDVYYFMDIHRKWNYNNTMSKCFHMCISLFNIIVTNLFWSYLSAWVGEMYKYLGVLHNNSLDITYLACYGQYKIHFILL